MYRQIMSRIQQLWRNHRPIVWTVIALSAIAAAAWHFTPLQRHFNHWRLMHCMQQKDYPSCLLLLRTTQLKGHLDSRLVPILLDLTQKWIAGKSASQARQFLLEQAHFFPQVEPLKEQLLALELRALEAGLSETPEATLDASKILAQRYKDQPEFLLSLGKMFAGGNNLALMQSVRFFKQALDLKPALNQDPELIASIQLALTQISRQHNETTYAIVHQYYLEVMSDFLHAALEKKEPLTLHNNAYQVLLLSGQSESLGEETLFKHHWLNLLSGNPDNAEAFQEALDFFNSWSAPAVENLDFSYFPNLDKVPDAFLQEAMKLLMNRYPEPTLMMLTQNLKDKNHDWRRANSFYYLKVSDGLKPGMESAFYQLNLTLKSYDYFADWLIDSIDHYAKQGESGRTKLKDFVNRIVALKQQSSYRKEHDKANVYNQIESYTRIKIGRRN